MKKISVVINIAFGAGDGLIASILFALNTFNIYTIQNSSPASADQFLLSLSRLLLFHFI